jgi:hypothetical protein
MPLNYHALGLIHLAYPGAKIVHCRRDPRDTCLSIFATPYRTAPEFAHDLETIAAAYREYLRLMDHWLHVIPASSLFEVDYEEVVGSPEASTRRLVEFVGLEWSDSCLDSKSAPQTVSTPSLWQVRQPVYQSSAGRWKNYERHLGPLHGLVER